MQLSPPQHSDAILVSFPEPHVLLLTLNRPSALNAMTPQMSNDLETLLDWAEQESEVWVVIVTGSGRMFCAGADLKAWNTSQSTGTSFEQSTVSSNPNGFGSISRRASTKPIIAAVNGGAFGGGVEMVLNCDLVVASEGAKFALPEVRRGVVAVQGGIPRLARIAGHQLASELLLLGKTITAEEVHARFGFVNQITPLPTLLPTALLLAKQITDNSPDAVQCTKRGLLLSLNEGVEDAVSKHVWGKESARVYSGGNIKEGLRAFSEKRKPVWSSPAKL